MNTKGFTLVEVLVSIAIFSILVAVGVGGFTNALHSQGEVASLIAAQSNASIALEQMTREIRTGYLFCDTPNTNPAQPNATCQWDGVSGCQRGGSGGAVWTCNNILDFYNADGVNVDYKLNPGGGALQRSQTGSSGYSPITGDNATLKYLKFTIFGNTEGDNWPARITISMGVVPSSSDPGVMNDLINLQTTVSARTIDCTQGASPIKC